MLRERRPKLDRMIGRRGIVEVPFGALVLNLRKVGDGKSIDIGLTGSQIRLRILQIQVGDKAVSAVGGGYIAKQLGCNDPVPTGRGNSVAPIQAIIRFNHRTKPLILPRFIVSDIGLVFAIVEAEIQLVVAVNLVVDFGIEIVEVIAPRPIGVVGEDDGLCQDIQIGATA